VDVGERGQRLEAGSPDGAVAGVRGVGPADVLEGEDRRLARRDLGHPDLEYGLAPSEEAYRDFELIGEAGTVLATLRSLTEHTPLTYIVHSGPAAGIDIRGEAHADLARFADRVMPVLKRW
jgi:hypothetical protein